MIRLTIMLHDSNETIVDEKKYLEEKLKLETDLKDKEQELSVYYQTVTDYETRVESNRAIQEQDKEIRKMYREHLKEVRRTALIVRAYGLLIWAVQNARKL